MTNEIKVALPYIGGRYYITMPSTLESRITYQIWGAGGGAGGADSHGGGNGAGGGFISGTHNVQQDEILEVFVGQSGKGGISATGGGGGTSGGSLRRYTGGVGGVAGVYGVSGGGGGAGGATVIRVAGGEIAIAGGGGAGGGGGNYGYGQDATGSFYNSNPYGSTSSSPTYTNGGTNGAWSNLLNKYSVWEGNGWYYWQVYFPATASYDFAVSTDDYGTIAVDDNGVIESTGYQTVFTNSTTITQGWHLVKMYGLNTYGGPAGIAATITGPSGLLWTTRYPKVSNSAGGYGQDHDSDGGGGGAGGGGYIGGAGGAIGSGDVGGYAGANGFNYTLIPSDFIVGEYGNGRIPGGYTDVNYVSGVGVGGQANSGDGGDGYAVITFYSKTNTHVKHNGDYKQVLPNIKLKGSYHPISLSWTKINGVWTPMQSQTAVTFLQDSYGWEPGTVSHQIYPPQPANPGDWGGGGSQGDGSGDGT